jgi:hypothetical protein
MFHFKEEKKRGRMFVFLYSLKVESTELHVAISYY